MQPTRVRPALPALIALAISALLGPFDLRLALIAAVGALLSLFIPAVSRWPLALVVAQAAMRGGLVAAGGGLAAIAALVLWPRPRTFGRRLLVLVTTTAVMAATTRALGPTLSALFACAVLLAPFEERAPRGFLAIGLLLASAPGLWALQSAWRLRTAARASGSDAAWALAEKACSRIGWYGCTEDALVARAQLAHKAGDDTALLATLDRLPALVRPQTELMHADAELAAGRVGPAHARLARLAVTAPDATAALSAQTAADWMHAQHRLSSKAIAGAQSFGGTIALEPLNLTAQCVKRGEPVPVVLRWRVLDGFTADENYVVFVHAYGPKIFFLDHALARPTSSLSPGESIDDPLIAPVPLDAAPGRYALEVGLYEPASGLRLHPDGAPGHVSFAVIGELEVCP